MEKLSSDFSSHSLTKDGLYSSCKLCRNTRQRYLRSLNPTKYRLQNKVYRDSHLVQAREASKRYYIKTRDKNARMHKLILNV